MTQRPGYPDKEDFDLLTRILDYSKILAAKARAIGAPIPLITMIKTIVSLAERVQEQYEFRARGIKCPTPPVSFERANLLYRDKDVIVIGEGRCVKVFSFDEQRVTLVSNPGDIYLPHDDDWNTDYMRFFGVSTDYFDYEQYKIDTVQLHAFKIADDKTIFIGHHEFSGSWFVYKGIHK